MVEGAKLFLQVPLLKQSVVEGELMKRPSLEGHVGV